MDRYELKNELNEFPVIDVHEHFETYGQTFGYSMPQFIYYGAYANTMAGALPKEWTGAVENGTNPETQFEALVKIYGSVRYSGCGRIMRAIAQKLGGQLRPEDYGMLAKGYESRTDASIGEMCPRIKAYLCNSAGHPLYGYVRALPDFLAGKVRKDEEMHRMLCVTGLHCVSGKKEAQDIAFAAQKQVESLADWESAAEKIISEFVEQGIAGFKDIYMYFRPFTVGKQDKSRALRGFERIMAGGPADTGMLDYMMYKVYEIISGFKKPLQIHTGCIIDSCESAKHLDSVMELARAFPGMPFDLLHLNYPMLDDYIMVLKSCSNVYADCTWITSMDRTYAKRFLYQALDLLPADRVILFGGDRHCAGEPVAAALDMTLDILAEVLGDLCGKKEISKTDALELAKIWLYEAPRQLYRL